MRSSIRNSLWFSSRRRTACMCKKRFCICCWAAAIACPQGALMPEKIVLAYSGGLDTSIIIPWLKENYSYDVIAMVGDVGQGDDIEAVVEKAYKTGASKVVVEDLREEFLTGYVFPALQAGAVYEHKYLLGTSLARPVIAKHQVDVALREGATAVSHGCTGKGNDQVRFELTYQALAPELKVIAPWREWSLKSREDCLDYAEQHGIPVTASREKIHSRDRNLWHLSHEGGARNAVGRVDLVENRFVGIKSRGCYETPGGTLLIAAHRELEALCLERDVAHFKQHIGLKYAELVYFGLWFTPLREALDAFIEKTQAYMTGSITLSLYKGNVSIVSRESEHSLYRTDLSSFTMGDSYDQKDAAGFIRILGLPSRSRARSRVEVAR